MDESEIYVEQPLTFLREEMRRMLKEQHVQYVFNKQAFVPTEEHCQYHQFMFGVPYGPVHIETPITKGPHNWWALIDDLVHMHASPSGYTIRDMSGTVIIEGELYDVSLDLGPSVFPVDSPRRADG